MAKFVYLNMGGCEANGERECNLLSRRSFIKRATIFLPLAFVAQGIFTRTAKGGSTITNRTISAASQNAIAMVNSTWARPVIIPSSWSKVRVGMRMHMSNTGANFTGGVFAFGLNSGVNGQYGDSSCTNFVGAAFDQSTTGGATWNFVNSGTTYYDLSLNGSSPVARARVGTANASALLYGDGAQPTLNAGAFTSSADRQLIFLDITRGSPNFTLHFPFRTSTSLGPGADVSAARFLLYMGQQAPAPSEGNYDTLQCASPTLAVSEATNGTLNAINWYWTDNISAPTGTPQIEVTDVAVAVLS